MPNQRPVVGARCKPLRMFSGVYIEVSASGKGLHIIGSGKPPAHKSRNRALGLEFYSSGRFVALTGTNAVGDPGADMSAVLPQLIATYFAPDAPASGPEEWTEGPCEEWNGPTDDDELIRRARNQPASAGAAFGHKASFSDLLDCNEDALAKAFPDPTRDFDHSAADQALASHLAYFTGKDCARIERIMRRSALVRDKWERSDYLPRTITRACASKERVLCDPKPPAATGGITLTPIERTLANVGTQDAVALIFAEKMKGKMLYDRTRNTWLEYDGTRWRLDKLGKAHNLIRDIARELNRENKASMGAASFCDGVGRHLQSAPEFARTSDQFDQDNYLLNTPAGTFDLGTSEMRSHNPGDMLTLCTGVAPDHRGAETFHRFISEITMNDSYLMHFHQVALGACLSGAVEGHWMLFWTGGGRNGKNTLGDLVQDAMGDYARKVPSSTLMAKSFESHPTEIANLQGIRLATSSEINDGDHWDEARINEVTGDAILSARFMRGDHFEFRRTHKHLIYGNYKPQLRSVSDGIRSRLKIVPFNASFKGREDPDLPKILREHLGYALAWLLEEGHRKWLVYSKQLPYCPAVEAESASYFENQSTPQLWLAERTERIESDDRPAIQLPKVTDLYRDYKQWKEARGERAMSKTRWQETMRGCEKVRTTQGIHYRGFRLLPLQHGGMPFLPAPLHSFADSPITSD